MDCEHWLVSSKILKYMKNTTSSEHVAGRESIHDMKCKGPATTNDLHYTGKLLPQHMAQSEGSMCQYEVC